MARKTKKARKANKAKATAKQATIRFKAATATTS